MPSKKPNGVKPFKYEVHPTVKLIPPMTADEFAKLKQDIKEHGQSVPILMKGDVLLDGLHRMQVCEELKIKPVIQQYVGNPAVIDDLIISRNIFRRHLTDEQRVMAVAKIRAPQLIKEAKERQAKHGAAEPGDENLGKETAEIIAGEAKTGIHRARQAVEIAVHGTDAQARAVIRRKESLADTFRDVKRKREKKPGKAVTKKASKVDKLDPSWIQARFEAFMSRYWGAHQYKKVYAVLAKFIKD